MAEGARMQAAIQDLSKRLEEYQARSDAKFRKMSEDLSAALSAQDRRFIELLEVIKEKRGQTSATQAGSGDSDETGMTNSTPMPVINLEGQLPAKGGGGAGNGNNGSSPGLMAGLSMADFPRFNGDNLKDWVCRCEQFFALDNTAPELKVRLAAMHLDGRAINWHQNYMRLKKDHFPTWPDYVVDLSARFGVLCDDPMGEIVSLEQKGTVEELLDEFESILDRLSLPPEHALSIFLASFKEHIMLHVRQFSPSTYQQAARIAKLYEASQKSLPKPPYKPSTPYKPLPPLKTTPNLPRPALPKGARSRPVSQAEMQERRAKGLCMFCEEPYTPGHHLKHKGAQLYLREGNEGEEKEVVEPEAVELVEQDNVEDTLQISVHALNGTSVFQTMRVTGYVGKKPIHILLGSGSTHNFLDVETAKLLGCTLELVKPVSVTVAGGNKLSTNSICRSFSFTLGGSRFCTEATILPLGSCDLVLGVQWLSTLGPILWDFEKLKMEFQHKGKKLVLRGITSPTVKTIKHTSLNEILISPLPEPPSIHQEELAFSKLKERGKFY